MELTLNKTSLDAHRQIYPYSCIPMAVELVLKQIGKLPSDSFLLQEEWKNKATGSFGDFDGRTVNGVAFQAKFCLPRNDQFPLKDLFDAISAELSDGRFVVISLEVAGGWHMHVIYGKDSEGDFKAVTKNGCGLTENIESVKRIVTDMKGTDILVYNPVSN